MTRLAAIALALLTLGGAAQAASASPDPGDPSRMVVQLVDLPPGFTIASRRSRPNATVARETGVPLATLVGWGRIDGFQAEYGARSTPPHRRAEPPWSAPRQARTARRRASRRPTAPRSSGSRARDRRATSPARFLRALGNAARLWETRFAQDGVAVVLYTVVWRTAGTLSNVAVAGVTGRLTVADVLAIARKQDAHVRAASRPAAPGLDARSVLGQPLHFGAHGALAQLGERRLCKAEVAGSIPARSTGPQFGDLRAEIPERENP